MKVTLEWPDVESFLRVGASCPVRNVLLGAKGLREALVSLLGLVSLRVFLWCVRQP